MKSLKYTLAFIGLLNLALSQKMEGQVQEITEKPKHEFWQDKKIYLNEDGSNYLKFALLSQVWVRNQEYNPGTTIFDTPKSGGTDIGIRRFRITMYGQIAERVFIYGQIGENNFNTISDRKQGFFIHDALGEYSIEKDKISVGAGISGWSGLSRFSVSSVGSLMGIDAPLFLESTNDVTDQFVRKLSVYAKGKFGKFDYRVALAQPMAVQKGSGNVAIGTNSSFSTKPPEVQYNGYFQYQFKDQEFNVTPYATGTYLGKKNVLNVGAGIIYQKDAVWHKNATNDTIMSNMLHLAVDVFYDAPIGSKGKAISFYGNFTHYDYGTNYIRNLAPMNPANGTKNATILNGSGNGFPAFGTGNVLYGQIGYKFKENLLGKTTLMPYVSMQHAHYERLKEDMNFYDVGINWLLSGQTSKFTLSYQNRPIYDIGGNLIDHKGAFIAQYQVSL